MTQFQFDSTGFSNGDVSIYKGNEYPIITVDFEERLIGIDLKIIGALE